MIPGDPAATRQYRWCIDGWWKLLVRDHGRNDGPYATAHNWDRSTSQLFNLEADPLEKKSVADQHPRIVEQLQAKLNAWRPEYRTASGN